jgi:hypothetical protein
MNSTIKPRKKKCVCGCNKEGYIFSKGMLKECWAKQHNKPIKRVSDKRRILLKEQTEGKSELEVWFENRRKELVGVCQCGCGNKSQKNDDTFYRGSCCHIFPKRKFKSVMCHPLNYVERAMFGGCHSVMDDTSMDRWVNFADWDDIKSKFYIIAPLLTNEEKATKFYAHLERLVLNN